MVDYSKKSSKKTTADGSKAYQRGADKEDRSLIYRNWRREVGKTEKNGRYRKTCYTSDLDQIEYVFHKDVPYPVAVFELTRYDHDEYDGPAHSWAKYRQSILDRFFLRDAQGKFVIKIAELLGCDAYIILFRKDLEAFWIFDMTHRDAQWVRKDADEYKLWLTELRDKKMESLKENA